MDQVKIAAGYGISVEKLAQDHSLFLDLCKLAQVDLGATEDAKVEYLFDSFVAFEKSASAGGKDLFASNPEVVLNHFNAFLDKKAEDAKEEDKKKEKDGDKDDTDKKASAYAQRIAAIAADEEYYAGLGKIAAAAYLSELEEYATKEAKKDKSPSVSDMRQTSLPGMEPLKERAQNAVEDVKGHAKAFMKNPKKTIKGDIAKASEGVASFLKNNPNAKRNAGIAGAAGLGLAGAGAAAHHLMKGREASEEKKAYDLRAAEYALDLTAKDGRFIQEKVAAALQEQLNKAASEGDEVSPNVKAASAQDINLGLEERAWEFLDAIGISRLGRTDSPDDDARRCNRHLSPVIGRARSHHADHHHPCTGPQGPSRPGTSSRLQQGERGVCTGP